MMGNKKEYTPAETARRRRLAETLGWKVEGVNPETGEAEETVKPNGAKTYGLPALSTLQRHVKYFKSVGRLPNWYNK